ncbi:MAG: FHA domain-containing protein [Bdellovibrionota bacterium]
MKSLKLTVPAQTITWQGEEEKPGGSLDIEAAVHTVNGSLTVGRSEGCGFRLNLPALSRRQCEITFDGELAQIRDLGSRNGTLVNGKAIEVGPFQVLNDGDEIKVVEVAIRVSLVDESRTDAGPGTIVLDGPTIVG